MLNLYRPITLSLFSGAGGLDIGFHQAGFRVIGCVEKETIFCQTLRLNLGRYLELDCQIVNQDICALEPDKIHAGQIDFIIGGPPCQSFSAIGRRAGGIDGILDERGSLFEHYCRLVNHYQPRGFLLDGTAFEGVEVKSGIRITSDMVRILFQKFAGQPVDRYYILSTVEPYIAKDQMDEVMQIVDQVRKQTGCQVIVNGLNQSLRYYLRLLSNTDQFLKNYIEQIELDLDVKNEHKELWFQILASL